MTAETNNQPKPKVKEPQKPPPVAETVTPEFGSYAVGRATAGAGAAPAPSEQTHLNPATSVFTDIIMRQMAAGAPWAAPEDKTARPLRQVAMLKMQQIHGNQAVQRFIQRATNPPTHGMEEDLGQRIETQLRGGHSLDIGVQRQLEEGLGADLSEVRVHTDGEADHLAKSVDAVAFTTGQDIFFRAGAYDPASSKGLRLLAHEATHTMQQTAGPVAGTPALGGVSISDPSDRFEQAADGAAAHVMAKLQDTPDTQAPLTTVQCCGATPCGCTEEEKAIHMMQEREGEGDTPLVMPRLFQRKEERPVQRKTKAFIVSGIPLQRFWDDEESEESDSGGGWVDSITKAGGEVWESVTEAGGEAVDWVAETGGEVADWVTDTGGAAVDTVTETAGSAYNSLKDTGGQYVSGLIEEKKSSLLNQISGAMQEFVEQVTFQVTEDQIATLNNHLATLSRTSQGMISIPGIVPQADSPISTTNPGVKLIETSTITALLQQLQASLDSPFMSPTPAPSSYESGATQQNVQRAALAAAPAAAGVGILVVLRALAIIGFILLAVWAISKAVKAAKEKIKECEEIHESYKKVGPCIKCQPTDTPVERAAKIACIEAEMAGRLDYLNKGCDYVLPGSIARGSRRAEAGHWTRYAELQQMLKNCSDLPTA